MSDLVTILEPWYDGGRVPGGRALELQLHAPGHGQAVGRLHDAGRGLHPQLRLLTHSLSYHWLLIRTLDFSWLPLRTYSSPGTCIPPHPPSRDSQTPDCHSSGFCSFVPACPVVQAYEEVRFNIPSLFSQRTCLISSISWGWGLPPPDTGGSPYPPLGPSQSEEESG